MLEKILGVLRINKLRIIQLLKADMNQVLRSAFTRNTTYTGDYQRTPIWKIPPNVSHTSSEQATQKKTNGIVFDNDAKG
jgi:hypothetical protein